LAHPNFTIFDGSKKSRYPVNWFRNRTVGVAGIFTPDDSFLQKKAWQWIVLVLLAMTWGSSFILMKKGMRSFSSDQVASLRLFISFLFYLPFIFQAIRKLTATNFLFLLIVGFIGNGIPAFLFTTGQTEVSSSLAGILNSLTPLFTIVLGTLLFGSEFRWIRFAGVMIGLGGTAGLILSGERHFAQGNIWYAGFIILATLFYGISANTIKHKLKELDGLTISTLAFSMIGPFAGISLLFSDFSKVPGDPAWILNLGYIVLLAFFGSFLAVILFNMLIRQSTALFATSVTYIIPVFAVIWGLIDGESVTFVQMLFVLIIFLGIYLVNHQKGVMK
jgi:drug/metabolite transporter (DMT)-like permease